MASKHNSAYEESQDFIVKAEALAREGDPAAARAFYLEAAELQKAMVLALPPERVRTRSVFGLSAATLLYRAGELDAASRLAHWVLSFEDVEGYSAGRLEDLLSRIANERFMESHDIQMAGSALSVVLRGDDIANGLAPPDIVEMLSHAALNLVRRMAAFKNGIPLERQAEKSFNAHYRAFVAEPILGSYRINLYLGQPKQLLLDFARPTVPAQEVIDASVDFVNRAVSPQDEGVREVVEDDGYRTTLIRLVRNLVPNGRAVGEVELLCGVAGAVRTASLVPGHREPIRKLMANEGLTRPGGGGALSETPSLAGTLRAVDLDKRDLRLDHDDGTNTALRIPDDIMDDVLGPLLNRRVRVTGRKPPGRGRKHLVVVDIEPAEDAGADESMPPTASPTSTTGKLKFG